jgi:ribulose-phosphate 3-epimerase
MTVHKLKIAPSLLSANFAYLADDIKQCETGGADILHFDSMDGHFVPNITIGPMLVRAVRSVTKLPISCHLMIDNPDKFIKDFVDAGANYISVHVENNHHLHRTLSLIKELGAKPGIALNPVTPLSFAFESAEYCDFILLMSVNPGFGGQKFISSFLNRAENLRKFLDLNDLNHLEIEVDGGIKSDNAKDAYNAGANILVSGTGIFKGNIIDNIKTIRKAVNQG